MKNMLENVYLSGQSYYSYILKSAFDKVGLYTTDWDLVALNITKGSIILEHYIDKIEEKKFLGLIPYTSIKKVAIITSEAKCASNQDICPEAKYDGLEILIINKKFVNEIKSAAKELEEKLMEQVKVTF